MSRAEDKCDEVEVSRLLAGAAKAVASARYCWLATTAENGGARARPMGRPNENDWTIRFLTFLTDGRSRKASDIRRAGKVTVIFQHDADDGYVTLIGAATLRESASEVRRRWKAAYAGRPPIMCIFLASRTERTPPSLRSRPSAWSFGFAASRQSHSDCIRQSSSETHRATGD